MTNENNMDTYKKHPNDAVAQVVAAFAQRQDVSADEIVALATRLMPVFSNDQFDVQSAPTATATIAPVSESAIAPALPLEKAVTDDKVYCLCCGRGFTMLKRHLKAEHGLTEDEYRQMFDLPESFPLVAPKYSERKAAYAKQVGLGKYNREPEIEASVSAS